MELRLPLEMSPGREAACRPEHYPANLRLLPGYKAIARGVGCTPAQLALAWLLARAPHVVPIPGTTSVPHLQENLAAAELRLDADTMARLDAAINQQTVSGHRYGAQSAGEVDTDTF